MARNGMLYASATYHLFNMGGYGYNTLDIRGKYSGVEYEAYVGYADGKIKSIYAPDSSTMVRAFGVKY